MRDGRLRQPDQLKKPKKDKSRNESKHVEVGVGPHLGRAGRCRTREQQNVQASAQML